MLISKISKTSPRLLKFYLIGNGWGLVITLLAGFVNLVVGPRNPGVFLVALFQLGFAVIVLVFSYGIERQGELSVEHFRGTRFEPWAGGFALMMQLVPLISFASCQRSFCLSWSFSSTVPLPVRSIPSETPERPVAASGDRLASSKGPRRARSQRPRIRAPR
jgi:hypothetical protein